MWAASLERVIGVVAGLVGLPEQTLPRHAGPYGQYGGIGSEQYEQHEDRAGSAGPESQLIDGPLAPSP